ncbi:MAG: dethiobiotin synthase [Deltaproteobacteria bacterium]|nr:dethiobiotin synthase [Deltaproteobacteria bacterium]
MTRLMRIVVTGTDTDVGKTVFAAGLVVSLGARYWKPIQAGLSGETDSDVVRRIAGLERQDRQKAHRLLDGREGGDSREHRGRRELRDRREDQARGEEHDEADRVVPEVYRLRMPASPHIAARHEGLTLDFERIENALPEETNQPLIIEGAGGLMVPIDDRHSMIDLFDRWKLPVVLCARTSLGTINHTLLSLEALERRGIPVVGVAFGGQREDEVETTIVTRSRVRHLGRLPRLEMLDQPSVARAFAEHIRLEAFR